MKSEYYQDELRYLRDVGPEFARAHPEIARFISDTGSDPDVERVLEGTAFLCGRIRQKLDDELPELTAGMMSLLWPHYLRPVPSMTILELLPDIEQMQGALPVDAEAQFASVRVDGTSCIFRSTAPFTLRPWGIQDARLETEPAQPMRLRIRFQASSKLALADLDLSSVNLHLAGDPMATYALYFLLNAHVDHIAVRNPNAPENAPEVILHPDAIKPAGLDRNEAVIPYPKHSFAGYRLLQEYFAFKNRFLFVDIQGLDRAVTQLQPQQLLEILITFNHRLESPPVISKDNIKLHCVPVINLFNHSADPVRLKQDRTQYLVQPARSGTTDRRHLEVYAVDAATGVTPATGMEARAYKPFYSFRHDPNSNQESASYYQTHVVQNITGGDPRQGTDTYISFNIGGDPGNLPMEETVSLDIRCTNRDLPAELRAGDITEPTDTTPQGVRFRNIIKPTPTICPPIGNQLQWRLISHMSLNYVSLTDVERFKELLRVYDFESRQDKQKAVANQRLIEGVRSIKSRFTQRMVRGAPLRGTAVEITLNEDHYAGEGDAYLFATILDRFFGLYATLNGFSQLTVKFERSGQIFTFPPGWGEQLTPADAR